MKMFVISLNNLFFFQEKQCNLLSRVNKVRKELTDTHNDLKKWKQRAEVVHEKFFHEYLPQLRSMETQVYVMDVATNRLMSTTSVDTNEPLTPVAPKVRTEPSSLAHYTATCS